MDHLTRQGRALRLALVGSPQQSSLQDWANMLQREPEVGRVTICSSLDVLAKLLPQQGTAELDAVVVFSPATGVDGGVRAVVRLCKERAPYLPLVGCFGSIAEEAQLMLAPGDRPERWKGVYACGSRQVVSAIGQMKDVSPYPQVA